MVGLTWATSTNLEDKMPTARNSIRHKFGGGWATDFGPTAEVQLGQDGSVVVPYLVNAENITFELDGGTHKVGGTAKLNSSAINSGQEIRALYDFWRQGTDASPAQRRIISTGTTIFNDDGNGSFSSLITGLVDNSVVSFAQLDDHVLIMFSDKTDDMRLWDQTTVTTLTSSSTVPRGAFGRSHKNRWWVAGDEANPSRLYFSVVVDNLAASTADWTGAGSGTIEIDPDDGDKITALISHKDELWVFKGPYKGSIHRISGSSPTGGDGFSRSTFVRGIGSAGPNSLTTFRDDIVFQWVDGSIHSLKATAAFGDFNESALSNPINSFLRQRVNLGRLDTAWAANDVSRSCVVFTLPIDTATLPNFPLCMDYRFEPVRWSQWPAFGDVSGNSFVNCVAEVIDQTDNDKPILMAGGEDGFVRKLHRTDRSLDGVTAYTATTTLPFLHYGEPMRFKELAEVGIGIAPQGTQNMTFGWQRDDNAQQTETVSQGTGEVLGGSITNLDITLTSGTGSIATITTASNHGLSVNDTAVIFESVSYDGRHTVLTVPSATTFTISSAGTADESSGSETVQTGGTSSVFVLGISVLGGASFNDRFIDLVEGGEFRSVQYEVSQGGNFNDLELHTITSTIKPGSLSTEN